MRGEAPLPGISFPLLGTLPPVTDPRVLVGSATADDAAIYQLTDDLALVLTTDFFTPVVDAPYDFGRVAAANAMSDVYAMGGRPVAALNLVGSPRTDSIPASSAISCAAARTRQRKPASTWWGATLSRTDEPASTVSRSRASCTQRSTSPTQGRVRETCSF